MPSKTQAITPIADDIFQLTLPLPFALNHVNCYLLRGEAGWTVVDTGINIAAACELWQSAFNEFRITPADIEKIVLTHTHPDHFGLAGWLQGLAAEADKHVPVYASPIEEAQTRAIWRNEANIDFQGWIVANGMTAATAKEVTRAMDSTRAMTRPHPPTLDLIEPGTTIRLGQRNFQAIHARGHSDGQLVFYDTDDHLILSGDQVLMKITPNIGMWMNSKPDPLGQFLTSLQALQDLNVRLALPGHKGLITDWRGRIEELLAHHDERLKYVRDALQQGYQQGPYDIATKVFPMERFGVHEIRFAVAETLAHIEYLRVRGEVQQADGIRSYSLA